MPEISLDEYEALIGKAERCELNAQEAMQYVSTVTQRAFLAVVKASMKHLEEYEDVFDMAVPNKHQSKGAKEAQDELRAALLPFRKE